MVCAAKATCTFFNSDCTYAEICDEGNKVRNALKLDPDCEPYLYTEDYKYLFEDVCTKSDTTRVVILVVVGIFLLLFICLTVTIVYWVFCGGGCGNSGRKSPPTTNAGIKGKSKFSDVKSAV